MTLKDAIYNRTSVRTFTGETIPDNAIKQLDDFIANVPTPWNKPMGRIAIIRPSESCNPAKFSTYGVIRGASHYMVLIVDSRTDQHRALLSAGYSMEYAVLKAVSLDIATCWIGGTFRRDQFAPIVNLKNYETIIAVVAMGKPAPRQRFIEKIMRASVHATSRKKFNNLFFLGDFNTPYPLHKPLSAAFENVRRAPSACNRQPWRLLASHDGTVEFYAAPDKGFQLIDMGIAMAHFDISRGFKSAWSTPENPTSSLIATAK